MKVYAPARSYGQVWLFGIALLVVVISLPAFLPGFNPGTVIMLVVMGPIVAGSLLLAWWFPTIRYELDPEKLVLCYGPFRYPVALKEIESVSKRNLGLSLWSSFRLPGFAMWTVPYSDVGNVFMCATRSLTDITLITTRKRKYGVTPADEAAFLADLQQYLKG